MSDAVLIAASVAATGIFAAGVPIIMKVIENKARAAEKAADNARQDQLADRVSKVADRAEDAAKLLVTNTEEVAKASRERNESLTAAAKITNDKLDVIHILVNSTLTAATQTAYDAIFALSAMMRRLIDFGRSQGIEPSAADLKALSDNEEKLAELRSTLEDRRKAAVAVERQQDIQRREGEHPNGTILDTIPSRPVT